MGYFTISLVRLLAGLLCMCLFYFSGMLIEHEFRKFIGWIVLTILGVSGIFLVFRSLFVSSLVLMSIWTISFFDVAIRGSIRLYFGLQPNATEIMHSMMNTHSHELIEFITTQSRLLIQTGSMLFFAICFVYLAEKALIKKYKRTYQALHISSKMISVVFLLLFVTAFFNPVMRRESTLFFWINLYDVHTARLLDVTNIDQALVIAPDYLSTTHFSGEKKATVVLIIGESLTRNNMSLYGYERDTTPTLNSMRDELIVFGDVISPSFYTAVSLPKMLTPATIAHPDKWKTEPDIVLLAKAAGYKTFWLSNQTDYDGIATFISRHADEFVFTNKGSIIAESTFDAVLFPHFEKVLQDPAPLKFIVLNLLGNHFNYELRYPHQYQIFDEVHDQVTQKMKAAGRANWVINQRNQYDNSVLYNDFVVSQCIKFLQKHSQETLASLVYASDHGQEIGYNRNFARHSAIDKTGWEIPLLMWTNKRPMIDKNVLEKRPYQTDRLESTILGLLQVKSSYYHPDDDILSTQFLIKERFMGDSIYRAD